MPVYTNVRNLEKSFSGSRIRHLNGYVRPSASSYFMTEVSGLLVDDEALAAVLPTISLAVGGTIVTSVSANAEDRGRINFSYSEIGASAFTKPTGSGTAITENCDNGKWSGNLNVSFEGPACDDEVRITAANGTILTYDSATNDFETLIDAITTLSTDTSESGTEYDPTEGETTFVRKEIFDADSTALPTDWADMA